MNNWIEINIPFSLFIEKGLNNPWTIIELIDFLDNNKTQQYLIGDVCPNGGGCGCCSEIHLSQIVKRYKIIDRQ
jgi:hypothetical protein